jgi:hypothetical protein
MIPLRGGAIITAKLCLRQALANAELQVLPDRIVLGPDDNLNFLVNGRELHVFVSKISSN